MSTRTLSFGESGWTSTISPSKSESGSGGYLHRLAEGEPPGHAADLADRGAGTEDAIDFRLREWDCRAGGAHEPGDARRVP